MRIHGGPLAAAVLTTLLAGPAWAQETMREEPPQAPPEETVPAAVQPSAGDEKPAEPENEARGYFERAAAAEEVQRGSCQQGREIGRQAQGAAPVPGRAQQDIQPFHRASPVARFSAGKCNRRSK